MFALTVVFGPAGGWEFMFKTKEAADSAYEALQSPENVVSVSDDFGQSATFNAASIHGVMIQDMNASGQATVERSLHQARLQNQAQRQAAQDPTLTGPRIATPNAPMFNGMGRN